MGTGVKWRVGDSSKGAVSTQLKLTAAMRQCGLGMDISSNSQEKPETWIFMSNSYKSEF